jgi:hypothetical protein
LLENRHGIPVERRGTFAWTPTVLACGIKEQGEDVAGEWVDVCGEALLGPENSRLM